MPIYEYQCEHCGHRLEAMQKMSEKPLEECPQCGRPDLKRLLSAPAFRLKGSGWYETDFKDGKKKNLHSSTEPKPGGKDDTKHKAKAHDSKTAKAPG